MCVLVCACVCPLCSQRDIYIYIQDIGISNVTLDVTFCVADVLLIVSPALLWLLFFFFFFLSNANALYNTESMGTGNLYLRHVVFLPKKTKKEHTR